MESKDLSEILRHGFDEFREFVNPLISSRAHLAGEPVRLVRASGGPPIDADGVEIEDMHGTQALGHRNQSVTAAMKLFLEGEALNWYPSRVNPFTGRLARRLCERTGYTNAYFGCSGSDGVESALKLARAATRRPRVLALQGAYHGCGVGSTALMSPGPFRDMFAPHLPGAESLPFNDVDALAKAFAAGEVAAIIAEPVQVEGGVRALSPEYIAALCELTATHGALLVADEVQTGLGRSGAFLASASWPRKPDVVVLAKTLGGGLVPVSAMLTHRAIFERAYGADFQSGEAHNCTFGFNAFTAVAALATLESITDELIAGVREKGAFFKQALERAMSGSSMLREIRGRGMMLGIEMRPLDHPWLSFEGFGMSGLADRATIAPLVCHRLYPRGFYAFTCGHDWSVLRLQPRYGIPDEKLTTFATALREECDHLAGLE